MTAVVKITGSEEMDRRRSLGGREKKSGGFLGFHAQNESKLDTKNFMIALRLLWPLLW
jgi:hypothetical protein